MNTGSSRPLHIHARKSRGSLLRSAAAPFAEPGPLQGAGPAHVKDAQSPPADGHPLAEHPPCSPPHPNPAQPSIAQPISAHLTSMQSSPAQSSPV